MGDSWSVDALGIQCAVISGSVIKPTFCSCRGPELSTQHPHGSSQSIGGGSLVPSTGLSGYCMHMVHIHLCRQTILHITISCFFFSLRKMIWLKISFTISRTFGVGTALSRSLDWLFKIIIEGGVFISENLFFFFLDFYITIKKLLRKKLRCVF